MSTRGQESTTKRMPMTVMGRILRPAVIVPLLLSTTLLVALLSVGNVATIAGLLRHLRPGALLAIALALVAYEGAKCAQWLVLLHGLRIRAPRRVQVFTYLVGEPARVLPIGNFVENYLLLRTAGTDVALSSAATMTSVLIEVGAALVGVALLGLGPWGWLRPLILLGLLGLAVVVLGVAVAAHRRRARRPAAWLTRRAPRALLDAARQFQQGALALRRPRVLLGAALLGGLYVALGGAALYLVARGLGLATLSWPQVLAIYCFSLASALILPLPVDVGVTETGGVAAFMALGVEPGVAVGAMVLLRASALGVSLLIGLLTLAAMPDVTRAVLRNDPRPRTLSVVESEAGMDDTEDAELARAG